MKGVPIRLEVGPRDIEKGAGHIGPPRWSKNSAYDGLVGSIAAEAEELQVLL